MREFNENNHGFTLIELIMVIVILGILSAIIVPKYFDFTSKAEVEVEAAFIGGLRSGIHAFSINKFITTGVKTFPNVQSTLLPRVLDEIPTDWAYYTSTGEIRHTRSGGDTKSWWYKTFYDSTVFKIDTISGGPPPPP
jgi:prepilin-type N-terminal cleavage/methylation domain-containing protein